MVNMGKETIVVEKELMNSVIIDIENLLDDMELMIDKSTMETVNKRLEDVKGGKTKGLTEKDFKDYVKKRV